MKLTSLFFPAIAAAVLVGYVLYNDPKSISAEPIGIEQFENSKSIDTLVLDTSYLTYNMTDAIVRASPKSTDIFVKHNGNSISFDSFCKGKTHIVVVTRPILTQEIDQCNKHDERFIEIPLARDGIAIVTNDANSISNLTPDQAKLLWGSVTTDWKMIDDKTTTTRIDLFGPEVDSLDAHNFELDIGASVRSDYTQIDRYSEIISQISTNKNAVAYMPSSQYYLKKTNTKAIDINGIDYRSDNYPYMNYVIMYVNSDALNDPEVLEFTKKFLQTAQQRAQEFGFIPLSDAAYEVFTERLDHAILGTAFLGKENTHITVNDLMAAPLCCGSAYINKNPFKTSFPQGNDYISSTAKSQI